MPLSYPEYLNLDRLLSLQELRSDPPEHDEMLFIIVHQVYELWFKQIIQELSVVQHALESNDGAQVADGFKRILAIYKTLVAQLDILETMTPVSFNTFRDRLDTASGLQSRQFREIELILGKRDKSMLRLHEHRLEDKAILQQYFSKPTLWQSFLKYLSHHGYTIEEKMLEPEQADKSTPDPNIQELLVSIYQQRLPLMQICERFVDLDEGIQEWRYRHVKMVERTIGAKLGTGGSAGVNYLKNTLFAPLFPDLWAIRIRL